MALLTRAAKGTPLTAAEHDSNLAGVQGGAVATIAALLALSTTTRADGLCVHVGGYNTNGDGGGGLFRFNAASTEESDGITCFVPGNLQSSVQSVSLARASLRADLAPLSVGQANLVFGSVEVVYSDGKASAPSGSFVTDLQLHGHGLFIHTFNAVPVPHLPEIDHVGGRFTPYGSGSNIAWHKLRLLIDTHTTAANFATRYRYANGAGRWLRVMNPGDPYTPAMMGCTPNNPAVNDYFRLAWLLNWALEDGREVLIDDWYHYKGTFELNEGTVIRQSKSWQNAGLKVCPWTTIPAIDHLANKAGAPAPYDSTVPAAILDYHTVVMIHGIDAKSIALKGLRVHGNVYSNQQFLTDPNYETTDITSGGTVSQVLRESPTWCGLAVTPHGGRPIDSSMRIILDDVEIGDFGGSCLLAPMHTRHFLGRNVAVGVSVSGRVKYGGSGHWENLWLYGYSRTAVERAYTETAHGHRYSWKRPDGTDPVRLWVVNANPENISGQFNTPANEEPGQPRGASISGLDWDLADSANVDHTMGFNLKGAGFHIDGRINTPAESYLFTVIRFPYDTDEGAVTASIDLDVFCRGSGGVLPFESLTGGWHSGSDIRMRIHQTFDQVTGAEICPTPVLPIYPTAGAPQITITIPPVMEPESRIDQQHLRLHIVNELATANLLQLLGLPTTGTAVTPANFIPTVIKLSGRISNNTNNLITGAAPSVIPAAGLALLPVRVLAEALTFNVFNPATPYVGDHDAVDRAFDILKLRGCMTPGGKLSEQTGSFTVAGSSLTQSTTDYYDVVTSLLWKPKQLTVTAQSTDVYTYFRYVEIRATSGSGSTANYIGCTLRFHFDAATIAGASLSVAWQAAVSPW